MKLICLLGNDPLQVLMPLQLTGVFDGAYIIADEYTEKYALRILDFLEENDDRDGPSWRESVEIVKIKNGMGYYEARQVIADILAKEYCRNEEVAYNYHSVENSSVKFAAIHTANYYLAPVIIVNSFTHRMHLRYKSWDRKKIFRENLPWIPLKTTVSSVLKLSGISYERSNPKGGIGFGYERKMFGDFVNAKESGLFDDVERNLILTRYETGQKKEIDIIVMKNGVLGFISLKSGINMRKKNVFGQEFKSILTEYPWYLSGTPCLRVLICKTDFDKYRFNKMINKGILAIDDVRTEEQTSLAMNMVAFALDFISKTGRPLPHDFYQRYVNKQFGLWSNEIGKMRSNANYSYRDRR